MFHWEIVLTNFFSFLFGEGLLHSTVELLSDFRRTALLLPLLLIALWKTKGPKLTLWIVMITGFAVALSDSISYQIVKRAVMRPRPNFLGSACLENKCWGFVSSHAANIFCAAMIIGYFEPRWRKGLLLIAGLVSFSRIALGDHFPLDVIGGGLLGVAIGFVISHMLWILPVSVFSKDRA